MSPPCGKLCLFITYLIHSFPFARSIHNYVSRVRTLHKELGLMPTALKSFQVCVMHALGSRHLHVNATPATSSHPTSAAPSPLLHHLQPRVPQSCLAGVYYLWVLRYAQVVERGSIFCFPDTLAGGTFSWLCQASTFWSGGPRPTSQLVEHQWRCRDAPSDPFAAYCLLLTSSLTTLVDQPLLTYLHWWYCITVTVPILS